MSASIQQAMSALAKLHRLTQAADKYLTGDAAEPAREGHRDLAELVSDSWAYLRPWGLARPEDAHPEVVDISDASPGFVAEIGRIAQLHQGLEYDAHDREADLIRRVAVHHGLTPMPSETITPRSYRGCAPPERITAPLSVDVDWDTDTPQDVAETLARLCEVARPLLTALYVARPTADTDGPPPPAYVLDSHMEDDCG